MRPRAKRPRKRRTLGFVLGSALVAIYLFFMIGWHFSQKKAVCIEPTAQVCPEKVEEVICAEPSVVEEVISLIITDEPCCEPRHVNIYPIPKRIDIGHIEGKGIGYETGYTKLSVVFAPEYEVGHCVSMLDLRGVVFDDGKLAANAGIIARFLPKSFCEVFGVNLFYDFREGKYGNFNQVSGGFDLLIRRWEVHGNASVPVGTTRHTKNGAHEYAEYAFDVNAGYYFVNDKNFQLYAGAGPYYLCGHASAVGGKVVLRPQLSDYLSVELSASYDRIFRAIYQANVVLTIPLYRFSCALKHKKGPCCTANRQIYQPIDRDIVLIEGMR
jgi:hypothetical protein